MERDNKIYISLQAKLLTDQMPNLDLEDLKDWFCNIRKISIGGEDIIDYLAWKAKGEKT